MCCFGKQKSVIVVVLVVIWFSIFRDRGRGNEKC